MGEAAIRVKEIIKERTDLIAEAIRYINIFLSLTVLILVIQSYLYLKKYLTKPKHDNQYINDAFSNVDNARRSKGKFILSFILITCRAYR